MGVVGGIARAVNAAQSLVTGLAEQVCALLGFEHCAAAGPSGRLVRPDPVRPVCATNLAATALAVHVNTVGNRLARSRN